MKAKVLGVAVLAATLAIFGVSQASANTVYAVHDEDFGAFVDGTITTDGTVGTLSVANIVAWSLTVTTSPTTFPPTPVTLTESNSTALLEFGNNLSATSTALFFDYASSPGAFFDFGWTSGTAHAFIEYNSGNSPPSEDCL